jgi:hypothetical protein
MQPITVARTSSLLQQASRLLETRGERLRRSTENITPPSSCILATFSLPLPSPCVINHHGFFRQFPFVQPNIVLLLSKLVISYRARQLCQQTSSCCTRRRLFMEGLTRHAPTTGAIRRGGDRATEGVESAPRNETTAQRN